MRALSADRARLALENVVLRQQLNVLKRSVKLARINDGDRMFWVLMHRLFADWKEHLGVVKPETVAMGIEEIVSAKQSPWQNPFVERVIGSIRRECTDHVIAWSEAHLRDLLRQYVEYYNQSRCHQSLDGNAPESRAVESGAAPVRAIPHLGGLHHRYTRAA